MWTSWSSHMNWTCIETCFKEGIQHQSGGDECTNILQQFWLWLQKCCQLAISPKRRGEENGDIIIHSLPMYSIFKGWECPRHSPSEKGGSGWQNWHYLRSLACACAHARINVNANSTWSISDTILSTYPHLISGHSRNPFFSGTYCTIYKAYVRAKFRGLYGQFLWLYMVQYLQWYLKLPLI